MIISWIYLAVVSTCWCSHEECYLWLQLASPTIPSYHLHCPRARLSKVCSFLVAMPGHYMLQQFRKVYPRTSSSLKASCTFPKKKDFFPSHFFPFCGIPLNGFSMVFRTGSTDAPAARGISELFVTARWERFPQARNAPGDPSTHPAAPQWTQPQGDMAGAGDGKFPRCAHSLKNQNMTCQMYNIFGIRIWMINKWD